MKLHHLLLFLFSVLAATLTAQTTEPPLLNNKFSVWSQRLDMSAYIGQKYRLTVAIRAEPAKRKAAAHAFIRNEGPEGGYQNWTFMDNMNARPVRSQEWQTYTLEGRVEKDAPWLGFGFLNVHNGAFYYDNVRLSVETEPGAWTPLPVPNGDFEADTLGPWQQTSMGIPARTAGANATIDTANPFEGKHCLRVENKQRKKN
ncbi:MAG: hypothetical protein H6559_29770 [Lewinellaceae bacterium]|nr:hypothetical protein [Lewinellaceae bacterium]